MGHDRMPFTHKTIFTGVCKYPAQNVFSCTAAQRPVCYAERVTRRNCSGLKKHAHGVPALCNTRMFRRTHPVASFSQACFSTSMIFSQPSGPQPCRGFYQGR